MQGVTMPNVATHKLLRNAYIAPISITEQSGKDLQDYTILVKLDSSWDGWDEVDDEGRDIVFVDDRGKFLYFWVEKFDKATMLALIWVRVPNIPANSVVNIYMLYGMQKILDLKTPTLIPWYHKLYHDPYNVFLFFDNFETFSGWSKYGDGNVYQDRSMSYEGCYCLRKDDNCDPNGGYKLLGFTIDRSGYALMYSGIRISGQGTDCYWDRVGLEDANWNGYSFAFAHGSPAYLRIDKRTNASATTIAEIQVTDILSTWYIAKLILLPDRVIARLYKDDYTLHAETTSTDTQYTTFDRVVVRGGRPYRIDVLRLLPHTEPEPAVAVEPSIDGVRHPDLI